MLHNVIGNTVVWLVKNEMYLWKGINRNKIHNVYFQNKIKWSSWSVKLSNILKRIFKCLHYVMKY